MASIGVFFGTDTGSTRKVAKLIAQALDAEKPLNINRVTAADLDKYDYLVFGTPTLGEGQLPGLEADCMSESWAEFIEANDELDLAGKTVALFGLGDQVNYANEFVDGLGELYDYVDECGATLIGETSTDGYNFNESAAVVEDKFVGLVIDKDNQSSLTEERVAHWVEQIKAEFAA
ncbi:flavodoxin [Photobacterium sp. ZSDE20]|uniref:Flavodoxin n=1 Tax=Photobacterium pectinilyticum TaxID=2906793 RepID=A0ABT1N1I8_9GAMM|nr:flavodoxin [Photobacterium sp. ZSDE20]MCQ1058593.1 flavodoxin [Photobacterium sp. ZSDE20]MDD1826285.1 flavodoxin [Photobacterium sp. ZSDE20]